jgi:leader peptidase (prepilin peptidase)/N-methyltransferase
MSVRFRLVKVEVDILQHLVYLIIISATVAGYFTGSFIKPPSRCPGFVGRLACAGLFAVMALHTGAAWDLIPLLVLAFVLLFVSFTDIETQEIPDKPLIFTASIGLTWVGLSHFIPTLGLNAPVWHDALLGAVAAAAPLFIIDTAAVLIAKQDAFGYGDMKLMLAAGLFLGWQMSLAALVLSVLAGGLVFAVLLVANVVKRDDTVPFGPFLALGILLSLLFGEFLLGLLFVG